MKRKVNLYPQGYLSALSKQAHDEIVSLDSKADMYHLNVLLKLHAKMGEQEELLDVLREMDIQGSFDRLAWGELLKRIIEFE